MKPLFPKFHQRLEDQANYKLKRPVRVAGITFGIILLLCCVGAAGAVLDSKKDPGELSLWAIVAITLPVAFWFSLISTGLWLTPYKIRRTIIHSLLPLQCAAFITMCAFYACLRIGGTMALDWIVIVLPILEFSAGSVLVALTLLSIWGWARYARGLTLD